MKGGIIMNCTGCGFKEHFHKDFKNPNKTSSKEKRLQEITEMKSKNQNSHLRLYFMEMVDESENSEELKKMRNQEPYVVKVAVPHEGILFNGEKIMDIMHI